jgi:hypothetical protein
MTWEEHNALCEKGDLTALVAQLEREPDPIERECFYVGTVNMSYRGHPQVAVAIGRRYIEEYYQTPEPFGSGRPPNGDVLKRLVLLLDPFQYEGDEEFSGNRELAIWVCKFALAFGLPDGTKRGFQGRLKDLEQASAEAQPTAPPNGGPAASSDNSSAAAGPPPVS